MAAIWRQFMPYRAHTRISLFVVFFQQTDKPVYLLILPFQQFDKTVYRLPCIDVACIADYLHTALFCVNGWAYHFAFPRHQPCGRQTKLFLPFRSSALSKFPSSANQSINAWLTYTKFVSNFLLD